MHPPIPYSKLIVTVLSPMASSSECGVVLSEVREMHQECGTVQKHQTKESWNFLTAPPPPHPTIFHLTKSRLRCFLYFFGLSVEGWKPRFEPPGFSFVALLKSNFGACQIKSLPHPSHAFYTQMLLSQLRAAAPGYFTEILEEWQMQQ